MEIQKVVENSAKGWPSYRSTQRVIYWSTITIITIQPTISGSELIDQINFSLLEVCDPVNFLYFPEEPGRNNLKLTIQGRSSRMISISHSPIVHSLDNEESNHWSHHPVTLYYLFTVPLLRLVYDTIINSREEPFQSMLKHSIDLHNTHLITMRSILFNPCDWILSPVS